MALAVVAAGGPLEYLRGPWNCFDAAMVLAGYTAFIPTGGGGSAGTAGIRAVRALRALRPLRTITRFEALRSIVVCFLEVRAGGAGAVLAGQGVRPAATSTQPAGAPAPRLPCAPPPCPPGAAHAG